MRVLRRVIGETVNRVIYQYWGGRATKWVNDIELAQLFTDDHEAQLALYEHRLVSKAEVATYDEG